jgi:hypothetical protein
MFLMVNEALFLSPQGYRQTSVSAPGRCIRKSLYHKTSLRELYNQTWYV